MIVCTRCGLQFQLEERVFVFCPCDDLSVVSNDGGWTIQIRAKGCVTVTVSAYPAGYVNGPDGRPGTTPGDWSHFVVWPGMERNASPARVPTFEEAMDVVRVKQVMSS